MAKAVLAAILSLCCLSIAQADSSTKVIKVTTFTWNSPGMCNFGNSEIGYYVRNNVIGDLDGNGYPELVVGNRYWYYNYYSEGAICILYMSKGLKISKSVLIDHITVAQKASYSITPYYYAYFGQATVPMGDVNGDKVPDIAVSAYYQSKQSCSYCYNGVVYIILLGSDGTLKGVTAFDTSMIKHTSNYEYFGWDGTNLGDLDGDGRSEIAFCSYNSRFVIIMWIDSNGKISKTAELGSRGSPFDSTDNSYTFLYNIAGVGDVDGDKVPDMAATYLYYSNPGASVRIIFLNDDGTIKKEGPGISVRQEPFSNFNVPNPYNYECQYVSSTGDWDMDGVGDLALGCQYFGGQLNGQTYYYTGAYFIALLNKDGSAKAAIPFADGFGDLNKYWQLQSYTYAGQYFTFADVDGDGAADFIQPDTSSSSVRIIQLSCPPGYGASSGKCKLCAAGQESSAGLCQDCAVGYADLDSDPSTPCTLCSAGTYSGTGQTTCTQCPNGTADLDLNPTTKCEDCSAGQYSPAGSTECFDCKPGTADTDSDPSTECAACDLGSESVAKALRCTECEKGYADLDGNPATACSRCPAGSYANVGAVLCIPCSAGKYDDDKDPSTPCVSCEPGFYSDLGATTCDHCKSGYADLDKNPSTPCTKCDAGDYTRAAAIDCTPCSEGTYDDDDDPSTPCATCPDEQSAAPGSTICSPCPAGTMYTKNAQGLGICQECDPGSYSAPGSDSCTLCKAGTADLDSDPKTPCQQCDKGTFQGDDGQTSCSDCPPGEYTHDSQDNRDACLVCDAGSQQTNNKCDGDTCCDLCDPNTYDDDSSPATACVPCPAGTVAGEGSTECTPCDYGWTRVDSNQATNCTICSAGEYTPQGSSGSCNLFKCPAGTVDTDLDPSTPCQKCNTGSYCPPGSSGAATNFLCPAGTLDLSGDSSKPCSHCDLSGLYVPPGSSGNCSAFPCPAGTTDADNNAATGCMTCPAGTYCPQGSSGNMATFACPAGYADEDSDPSTNCTQCGPGQYTAGGAFECSPCGAGTYDDDSDPSTQCKGCPVDGYTAPGSTVCGQCAQYTVDDDQDPGTPCKPCAAGTTLAAGQTPLIPGRCNPCPAGTYRSLSDASPCITCSPGYGCPAGSTSQTACKPGQYSEDGVACLTCPANTFSAGQASDCSPCGINTIDDDGDPSTPCVACRNEHSYDKCASVEGCNSTTGADNQCIACNDGLTLTNGVCSAFTVPDTTPVYQVDFDHPNDHTMAELELLLRTALSAMFSSEGIQLTRGQIVVTSVASSTHVSGWVNATVRLVFDVDQQTQNEIESSRTVQEGPLDLSSYELYNAHMDGEVGEGNGVARDAHLGSSSSDSGSVPGWGVALIIIALIVVFAIALVMYHRRSTRGSFAPQPPPQKFEETPQMNSDYTTADNPVFENDSAVDAEPDFEQF